MTKEELAAEVDSIPVGTGMSGSYVSDTYPYVVTRKSRYCLFVKSVPVGNNKLQWPDQDYDVYLDKPEGPELKVTFTKKGWSHNGMRFSFGARHYLDPSF